MEHSWWCVFNRHPVSLKAFVAVSKWLSRLKVCNSCWSRSTCLHWQTWTLQCIVRSKMNYTSNGNSYIYSYTLQLHTVFTVAPISSIIGSTTRLHYNYIILYSKTILHLIQVLYHLNFSPQKKSDIGEWLWSTAGRPLRNILNTTLLLTIVQYVCKCVC